MTSKVVSQLAISELSDALQEALEVKSESLTPEEWAAQIWCRPENSDREMDVLFARSIADAMEQELRDKKVIVTKEDGVYAY